MVDPVVDLLYRCLGIEVGRNVTNFEHRSHSNFFHQKYPQKTRKTKEALNVQVRMSSFDLQTGIIACCQYTVMQLLVRLCVSHWMLSRVVNYIVHMPVCCGGGEEMLKLRSNWLADEIWADKVTYSPLLWGCGYVLTPNFESISHFCL